MDVTVPGEVGRRLEPDIAEFERDLRRLRSGLIPAELREPRDAFVSLLAPLSHAGSACRALVRDSVRRGYRIGPRASPHRVGVGGAGEAGGGPGNGAGRSNGTGDGDGDGRAGEPDDPVAVLLRLDERLQRLLAGLALALAVVGDEGPGEFRAALEALREAAGAVRRRLDAFEPPQESG